MESRHVSYTTGRATVKAVQQLHPWMTKRRINKAFIRLSATDRAEPSPSASQPTSSTFLQKDRLFAVMIPHSVVPFDVAIYLGRQQWLDSTSITTGRTERVTAWLAAEWASGRLPDKPELDLWPQTLDSRCVSMHSSIVVADKETAAVLDAFGRKTIEQIKVLGSITGTGGTNCGCDNLVGAEEDAFDTTVEILAAKVAAREGTTIIRKGRWTQAKAAKTPLSNSQLQHALDTKTWPPKAKPVHTTPEVSDCISESISEDCSVASGSDSLDADSHSDTDSVLIGDTIPSRCYVTMLALARLEAVHSITLCCGNIATPSCATWWFGLLLASHRETLRTLRLEEFDLATALEFTVEEWSSRFRELDDRAPDSSDSDDDDATTRTCAARQFFRSAATGVSGSRNGEDGDDAEPFFFGFLAMIQPTQLRLVFIHQHTFFGEAESSGAGLIRSVTRLNEIPTLAELVMSKGWSRSLTASFLRDRVSALVPLHFTFSVFDD